MYVCLYTYSNPYLYNVYTYIKYLLGPRFPAGSPLPTLEMAKNTFRGWEEVRCHSKGGGAFCESSRIIKWRKEEEELEG